MPTRGALRRAVFEALPFAAAILTVSIAVVALRHLSFHVNTGTATSTLLLSVLLVARLFGTAPALLAAAYSGLSYMYFFLAPRGLTIENPNDWIAFGTFMLTAVVAGGLWATARRRQREIERLYRELQVSFEQTAEAEAARRSEQLKATLLDALTHNLRTPLTSIKAAATALLDEEVEDQGDARRELVVVINEEADRLNRFIGSLDTEMPEGEPARPAHSTPAHALLQATLAKADGIVRYHRMLVSEAPELTDVMVDAPSAIEALYLLVDNATKYSPAGTAIQITAAPEGAEHVRIAISDEGPGIAPDLRERVFEKFYRIPTHAAPGSGLGLSIARRLLETQGGRIWIEGAASGRGTCVIVTLPAVAALADAGPTAAA
jgi:K+-sensing histidine kinase KdpD